jgi:hypothetical protein
MGQANKAACASRLLLLSRTHGRLAAMWITDQLVQRPIHVKRLDYLIYLESVGLAYGIVNHVGNWFQQGSALDSTVSRLGVRGSPSRQYPAHPPTLGSQSRFLPEKANT